VAFAVLLVIMVLLVGVVDRIQDVFRHTSGRIEEFREARRAFETITRTLSQTTLNTYWDYVDSSGKARTSANMANFTPATYARFSELRFKTGDASALIGSGPNGGTLAGKALVFQAPLGVARTSSNQVLNGALNTVGYYVEKCEDPLKPGMVAPGGPSRWRLFQMMEPAENLTIYNKTSGNSTTAAADFFDVTGANTFRDKLADNIVNLVFLVEYPDGNTVTQTYDYDSTPKGGATQGAMENNLPSSIKVAMIAIDAASARRMEDEGIDVSATGLFQNPEEFDKDLATYAKKFDDKFLKYQIFTSAVKPKASQFSVQ